MAPCPAGAGKKMSVERWCAFVREMRATNSRLVKISIVQKYHDLTPLWRLIYDPQKTTGVTAAAIHKHGAKKRKVDAPPSDDLMGLLEALTTRALTGHAALDAIHTFLRAHPGDREDYLIALFDGNPRLGIDVKQMNAALAAKGHPIVCTVFNVALAHPFSDARFAANASWYLSRKLDGVRVLVDARTRVPYTRNGNPVASVARALQEMRWPADADGMLDGEMCILEDDGVTENFREAVSQLRQTKKDVVNFRYFVFDLIPRADFDVGAGRDPWSVRMERARALITALADPRVVAIETELYGADALARWQTRASAQKWEGLMVRRDAPYVGERTNDLLKLKAFQDLEAIVKDITVGTKQILNAATGAKEERRTMAAATILYKGAYVHVGSGWTDEQRLRYIDHPEEIIGKTITVSYFEECKDKTGKLSLRFPTVKCVWGETRDM